MSDDWESKYWQKRLQQKAQQQQQQDQAWPTVNKNKMIMHGLAQVAQASDNNQIFLREGYDYYRNVETNGFGSTVPVVRTVGRLEGVGAREFVYRGTVNCYLVDNLDIVDFSKVQPDKLVKLIQVEAPFLGRFLVKEEAIIYPGGANKQLLND